MFNWIQKYINSHETDFKPNLVINCINDDYYKARLMTGGTNSCTLLDFRGEHCMTSDGETITDAIENLNNLVYHTCFENTSL